MTQRALVLWPDPRLRAVCPPCLEDPAPLIRDLFETMYNAPGRGLAAPQIGVATRVFVIDVTWKDGPRTPIAFVNPEIVEREGDPVPGPEACLSIPGLEMQVARAPRVRMRWTDATGAGQDRWLDGPEAICAQHELDHLDGRVILDHQPPALRARLELDYAP